MENSKNEPVLIACMGLTGSGKSTFINVASGADMDIGSDSQLTSVTQEVQLSPSFSLDGRQVVLMDTPGFDDTNKSPTDILTQIAVFLSNSYKEGVKLAGVLFFHRIVDNRMGGIAVKNFGTFRNLCGEKSLRNVVIVTNMWQLLETPGKGEDREKELKGKFFRAALDKGAQMARHCDNTQGSAFDIIRLILKNKPLPLLIQKEMVDEGKDITETTAGVEVRSDLMDLIKAHEKEMQQLRKDLREAIKEKDEETMKELEEETRRLRKEVQDATNSFQKMASDYAEQNARFQQMLNERTRNRGLFTNLGRAIDTFFKVRHD